MLIYLFSNGGSGEYFECYRCVIVLVVIKMGKKIFFISVE